MDDGCELFVGGFVPDCRLERDFRQLQSPDYFHEHKHHRPPLICNKEFPGRSVELVGSHEGQFLSRANSDCFSCSPSSCWCRCTSLSARGACRETDQGESG